MSSLTASCGGMALFLFFPSPLHRIGGVDVPFKTDAADRILYHSHLLEDGRDVSTPTYEGLVQRCAKLVGRLSAWKLTMSPEAG